MIEKLQRKMRAGVQIVGPRHAIPLAVPIENLKEIVKVAEEKNNIIFK